MNERADEKKHRMNFMCVFDFLGIKNKHLKTARKIFQFTKENVRIWNKALAIHVLRQSEKAKLGSDGGKFVCFES